MTDCSKFFDTLWGDFAELAPQAAEIRTLLEQAGEVIHNDHVAFRTFNRTPLDLLSLEPVILGLGYRLHEEYHFEAKKLRARAYLQPGQPRIFLSELLVEKLPESARALIHQALDALPENLDTNRPGIFSSGRLWPAPRFEQYQELAEYSEYAAWLLAHGLHANHFTVSVNALTKLTSIEAVLRFVEAAGYRINEAGGRVKGTPEQLLEQGSTLADQREVAFADGTHSVPTCYYEFALRHADANGRLYEGFVPASADRIFESTNR